MTRNISNSEVNTWLTCKQQYNFAFVRKIEPKQLSDPLTIGNLGHDALEAYCKARQQGLSHDDAQQVSTEQILQPAITQGRMDLVLQVQKVLTSYHGIRQGWPEWEILGAEQKHELGISEDFTLPMRYDLLVREHDTGAYALVDYKFVYNFWTPDEHDLNIQFPKYLSVLNANGYDIEKAYLEEIRYRPKQNAGPSDITKRTRYVPSDAKKRHALRQHIMASLEITDYRNLSPDEQKQRTIPILNKFICKGCGFRELCISELDGGDIEYAIENNFVANTYDYNKKEEVTAL